MLFDDDEQVPVETRDIHQRLLDDSRRWVRKLPADSSVAEFARTLPQRMPSPSASSTQNTLARLRSGSILPNMMRVKGHTTMDKLQGPARTLVASIAAVAVVTLIVGVLYGMNVAHGGFGGGTVLRDHPAPTSVPSTPTPGPGSLYGAIPGPQAKYISEIVTAGGHSAEGNPTNTKTHFLVNDWVYVVAMVRGLPTGSHVISIAWYINGVYVELPVGSTTSETIDGDKRVIFGLQFPTPGLGKAEIFIDRPANAKGDDPRDPTLAETVIFVVEMDAQPTATPYPQQGIATPTPYPQQGIATPTPYPQQGIATPTPHP